MNNIEKLAYDVLNGRRITIIGENDHEYSISRVAHNIKCCELSILDLTISRTCSSYSEIAYYEAIWHDFIKDDLKSVAQYLERRMKQ